MLSVRTIRAQARQRSPSPRFPRPSPSASSSLSPYALVFSSEPMSSSISALFGPKSRLNAARISTRSRAGRGHAVEAHLPPHAVPHGSHAALPLRFRLPFPKPTSKPASASRPAGTRYRRRSTGTRHHRRPGSTCYHQPSGIACSHQRPGRRTPSPTVSAEVLSSRCIRRSARARSSRGIGGGGPSGASAIQPRAPGLTAPPDSLHRSARGAHPVQRHHSIAINSSSREAQSPSGSARSWTTRMTR